MYIYIIYIYVLENHHLYKIVYQWAIFYKIILNDQRIPKKTPRSHKNSPCSPEPLRRNILRDVWPMTGYLKKIRKWHSALDVYPRASAIASFKTEKHNFTKMRIQVLSWCSR